MATETASTNQNLESGPIVFYDGECGFCDRWVQWVIAHDKVGRYRFAALQGTTAKQMLGELAETPSEWSVILVDESGRFDRSTAAIRILAGTGTMGKLANLLFVFPRWFRDWFYEQFAKIRYRVFGRVDSCKLPSKELRTRFLP